MVWYGLAAAGTGTWGIIMVPAAGTIIPYVPVGTSTSSTIILPYCTIIINTTNSPPTVHQKS